MILSAALLLRHGLGRETEAAALESAVDRALEEGIRPPDLGGTATTAETTEAVLKEHQVSRSDLIWMNGELVAYEDAKVHVLTHALHYGTGVFEGVRAYETPRGTAIFRHADHIDRLFRSAALYHMEIPYSKEEIRAATHEVDPPQRLQVLLHPAARVPRRGADGAVPARLPGRGDHRHLGVGGLPRRRGQAQRRAREGVELAADPVRQPDPAAPRRPASTSTRCSPRSRPTRPATRRRSCSTAAASCARAPARTCSWSRAARSPRRASATTSSAASTALAAIEIAQDLGYDVVERDVARGELYHADEIFMTGTAAELTPIREVDDLPGRRRRARPDHRAHPVGLRGRPARALRALRGLARRGAGRAARRMSDRDHRLRHDPARRDAGRGDVALGRGEGARRAHPRRARRADDRGRLPDVEPEGARAVRAPARRGR